MYIYDPCRKAPSKRVSMCAWVWVGSYLVWQWNCTSMGRSVLALWFVGGAAKRRTENAFPPPRAVHMHISNPSASHLRRSPSQHSRVHWFKSSWRCAWAKIALIAFSGATPSSNIARHPASRISPEHDRGRPPPPRGDAAATTAAATDVEAPPPKMLLESSPRRLGCVMSHSSASTCDF